MAPSGESSPGPSASVRWLPRLSPCPGSRLRLPISASVLVCPAPLRESLSVVSSDKDISHTRVRARPSPVWPDLNSLHPHGACFPCFPKSSHSEVPVDVNLGEILSISAQASSAKGTRLSPYSAGGQKDLPAITPRREPQDAHSGGRRVLTYES